MNLNNLLLINQASELDVSSGSRLCRKPVSAESAQNQGSWVQATRSKLGRTPLEFKASGRLSLVSFKLYFQECTIPGRCRTEVKRTGRKEWNKQYELVWVITVRRRRLNGFKLGRILWERGFGCFSFQ